VDSALRRVSALPRVAGDPSGAQLRSMLASLDAQRRSSVQHAASYQVEIHKKFSLAVSCIVFVLIGAPIALRFPRGGVGLVIGASVVIFGIYYIGLIGGESLADRRLITPFWAMWTPNVIMATVGALLFMKLGTERTTARGGAFMERLQGWFRRRKLPA
jgi:lipopolysaccharide export system permease protein